jgi:hypothetical protein
MSLRESGNTIRGSAASPSKSTLPLVSNSVTRYASACGTSDHRNASTSATAPTGLTLIAYGSIKGTGPIGANAAVTVSKVVSVPDGYYLTGIRRITTNYDQVCSITEFTTDANTNTVSVKFANSLNQNLSLTVNIEWFALRSEGEKYTVEDTVSW